MSVERRVLLVLANVLFPGLAFGLMARPRWLAAWLAAVVVTILACTISVWCLPLFLVVMVAGAVAAYRGLGRHEGRLNWPLGACAILVGFVLVIVVRLTALEAFKMPSPGMSPTLEVGDRIFAEKITPRFRAIGPGEPIVFQHPCTAHTFVMRVVAHGGQTVEVRCGALYVDGVAVPTKRGATTCSYPDAPLGDGERVAVPCSEYVETLGGRTYRIHHQADYPEHASAPGVEDFPLENQPPPSCARTQYASRTPSDEVLGVIAPAASPSADACAPRLHYVVPAGHLFVMGDNRDNSWDSRSWGAVPESAVVGRIVGIWGPLSRFGSIE